MFSAVSLFFVYFMHFNFTNHYPWNFIHLIKCVPLKTLSVTDAFYITVYVFTYIVLLYTRTDDDDVTSNLHKLLQPFLLRRVKSEVRSSGHVVCT